MDEAMHHAIQVRAYFLWLQAGRPDGQDVLHWLQAEAELGLSPEADESELARSSASEAAASQAEEETSPQRPPAGEPYG